MMKQDWIGGGGQVVYLVDSNDNWEQEEKEHIYEEAG